MNKISFKRVGLMLTAAIYGLGVSLFSLPVSAVSPTGATLNTHPVLVDDSNKIVSWVPNQDQAYGQVSKLAWDYLINLPNQSNGKPAYYSYSYMNPSTEEPVGWPHNPAGLYGMLAESAVRYYQYSGDNRVLTIAKNVADHQLVNGMTATGDNWSNVPYASGERGSLTYRGASQLDPSGGGDGIGVIEPDKVAEFGVALVQLYKLTGDQKYLNAAINNANQLASHIRTGNANQSPWPFRVVAANNTIKEQYCSNMAPYFELLDQLIGLNAGNVSSYQTTRTAAWNWTMTYPIQNNYWQGYFEDVEYHQPAGDNLNQLNAMMMARYLLQNPDKDASWEAHVRGLIAWTEQTFGGTEYGSTQIREQKAFDYRMGSHTARYAAINALLYEKTGDTVAKEKAYRSFNWATYMARSNGVVIDGPEVNNQWFTDGYGDYVRQFMIGMGASPEWAPNGQTHIIETTSLINSVAYATNSVSYQTFDISGIEKIKVDRLPSSVTLGGTTLTQRSDLVAQGWVYDAATSTISIRRDVGKNVVVTFGGNPTNQAPAISLTSPSNGSSLIAPANVQITATASDPEGGLTKVEFYQNGSLIATDSTAPFTTTASNLTAGTYSFTAKAYDATTSTTSAASTVTVGTPATGWTNSDIGSVGVAGSATVNNGVYTVKGSGVDIWDNADSFNFQSVTMSGDGEIKARVISQQNTDQWALAGIMLRDNLTPVSRHVLAAATPVNGLAFDYRSSANGLTSYVNGGAGAAPYYLRLTRVGNVFTAYKSTNGTTWTSMGSSTIAMGTTLYAGLAVTSHNNSVLGTATFDNVSVTGQGQGDTTAPIISAVTAGSFNVNGGSVSWTTNEPATSQIEYGPTTAYGTSSPLNSSLDSAHSQVVSGLQPATTYNYRVKSIDAAGNAAVSGNFQFTTASPADTTAPTAPTNVMAQALSSTSAKLTWTASTDNVGVAKYTVYRNGTQIGTASSLTYTDTNLTAGTTYSYTVSATDAADNVSGLSAVASLTTPVPDTTAPTVTMSAPAAAATVAGTVQVSATANDNSGVAGVQFKLDGNNLSTEDTSSPYQVSWNTTTASNGTHTLTAVARDTAGNITTSSNLTVTVQNVISNGLVAAYNFNDASGMVLNDRVGTHAGTINGATWSTTGKYGGALSFNGTNNTVTIADANDLDLTNAATIEAWIKPTSVSGWRSVLLKESSTGLTYALYAGNSANKAAFYGNFAGNDISADDTTNTSTTTWTHLTGTYDGTTLRLYINGVLKTTKAQSGAMTTSSGALKLGGNSIWGEYYSGLIDDVRIYNRVLSQTEIQTDMNAPIQ